MKFEKTHHGRNFMFKKLIKPQKNRKIKKENANFYIKGDDQVLPET